MAGETLRWGSAPGRVARRWRGLIVAVVCVALATGAAWASDEPAAPAHGGAHPEAKHEPEHGETHPEHKHEGHAGAHDPLEHVMDSDVWDLFPTAGWAIHLPNYGQFLRLTKFMILEVIAAILIAAIYIPMARRLQSGQVPHGPWDNSFEVLLTFVREEIARPALSPPEDHGHGHGHEEGHGHHDPKAHGHAVPAYDKYVPFLWTLFLFILFNNLMGMFPFGASATASVYATGALALIVFFAIHGSAMKRMGVGGYLRSLWPQIDVPFPMNFLITPVVFVIELVGTLVRNAVLAVRLFANMFAGHTVLAVILGFIVAAKTAFALWATVTVSSILGVVALSLLEIFVAFLQAYIFTFLTALFMGMAIYPAH